MLKPVIIILSILVSFFLCKPNMNFGPYKMRLNDFIVCSGPKPKNCTKLEANVTGDTTIYLNLQVLKKCSPTKGKIVALGPNGKEIARFQMNKPCEHLFIRPMLNSLFNLTKNCEILVNDYSRQVDVGHLANEYFAGNFFYGNLTIKAQYYNDECNFACTILKVTLTPKEEGI